MFNMRADIMGLFTEEIAPGAFEASLASGADVVGLVDHDSGKPACADPIKTLRLSEDSRGLASSLTCRIRRSGATCSRSLSVATSAAQRSVSACPKAAIVGRATTARCATSSWSTFRS